VTACVDLWCYESDMDVYHGIEYSWHIFMFSGVRVKVHWWRPRRQRVYPFASVSLRVIATPDCASTFGHDLIVSAAVYIVCTCTRTHSYAHHAHIDTSVLYARWIPCVHVDRYAYGLWTYVRVSAYEERKSGEGRWGKRNEVYAGNSGNSLDPWNNADKPSATYEYWCTFLDGQTTPLSLVSIREPIIFPSLVLNWTFIIVCRDFSMDIRPWDWLLTSFCVIPTRKDFYSSI